MAAGAEAAGAKVGFSSNVPRSVATRKRYRMAETANAGLNCYRYDRASSLHSQFQKVLSYSSRLPSIAFDMVTSSAYSMSLPAGMPVAMRVTFTPARLISFEI